MGRLIANALLLSIAVFVLVQGDREGPTLLLPPDPELTGLESSAGRDPSPKALAALADAYLDRGQPGLASSVLRAADDSLRADPAVGFQEARAQLALGHARRALKTAIAAEDACERSACAPHLAARLARERSFLEALVSANVEDPRAEPERARLALEHSRRAVQLVAIR